MLVFDNSYSKLRPKACVYLVKCAKDAYVVPVLETVTDAVPLPVVAAASEGTADLGDIEPGAPSIDDSKDADSCTVTSAPLPPPLSPGSECSSTAESGAAIE